MARARTKRAKYPLRCKICGHSWLSWSWAGPAKCPGRQCGNARWREGPAYLTENRKAQGYKSTKGLRKGLGEEGLLLGTPLYADPIEVEPIGLVPDAPVEAQDAPGCVDNAIKGGGGLLGR